MSGFDKVLIANRGEIAVRLIRACRALDLLSVAVYSDADADALHVELADEAVHIGPAEARASYLDAQALIRAAQETGAGAIHPGYGFLSENADFARACAAAGLVFVGPSADVIASMGAKSQAKRLAIEAGVACVPGYHGEDQSDERLMAEAQRIGTPLLIKASAGGGGRGMRRVNDLSDLNSALRLAREEARSAFGDATLLLERYIEAPRHIEVQILGDHHGQVRHLFERDCSVQRHYQKIIEEAPAPNLDPTLRQQVLDAAVRLAEAIGYDNAGTVEFVVDAQRGEAYFLEMNTRLQVEHPVTEMVTGVDLAIWQLRIAAGERIDFAQAQLSCRGWAIEARIAAEDPAAGYQPQTGRLTSYREPRLDGVRVDSGVRAGSEVSPYYDSMLAKLIAHGPDRAAARRKLGRALADFHVDGPRLNTAFLQDVLCLPAFVEGRHLTGLLSESWPEGWRPATPQPRDRACAVLARHLAGEPIGDGPWERLGAWRIGQTSARPGQAWWYLQDAEGQVQAAQVRGCRGDFEVILDGEPVLKVSQARLDGHLLSFRDGQGRVRVAVALAGEHLRLTGHPAQPVWRIAGSPGVACAGQEGGVGSGQLTAPTPGQVVEVLVAEGEDVSAGQPLVVLEAMKMLQQLCASQAGVVTGVSISAGDAVNSGDLLVSLAAQESE